MSAVVLPPASVAAGPLAASAASAAAANLGASYSASSSSSSGGGGAARGAAGPVLGAGDALCVDDLLRLNLLAFIQENVGVVLGTEPQKRLRRAFEAVFAAVKATVEPSVSPSLIQVRSQAMMTFTAILVDQDSINTQTHTFEAFVELLVGLVSKVNGSPDRELRATGCQCLRELELMYPGLLCKLLGRFMDCVTREVTHVHQNYAQLFLTVLEHSLAKSDFGGLVDAPTLAPFSVSNSLWQCTETAAKTSLTPQSIASLQQNIAKVFSQVGSLSEYNLLELMDHVHVLMQYSHSEVATASFLQQLLQSMLSVFFPPIVHAILLFTQQFTKLFSDDDRTNVFIQVLQLINDVNIPLEYRLLAMKWISRHLSEFSISRNIKPSAVLMLFPAVFDHIHLKEAKLLAMSMCRSEVLNSRTLVDSVVCLSEFESCPLPSKPGSILFSTLAMWVAVVPDSMQVVYRYLSDLITVSPQFTDNIINLIHNLPTDQAKCLRQLFAQSLPVSLSRHQEQEITFLSLPFFMELVFDIVSDKNVDIPCVIKVVKALHEMLRHTNILLTGDLKVLHSLLAICKEIIDKHYDASQPVWSPLHVLLEFILRYSSNAEIRDKASRNLKVIQLFQPSSISFLLGEPSRKIIEARKASVFPKPAKPVLTFPQPISFLELMRFSILPALKYPPIVCEYPDMSDGAENNTDTTQFSLVAKHRALLSQVTSYIRLPCRLTFNHELFCKELPEQSKEKLYGIVLSFTDTSSMSASVPNVRIPVMSASQKSVPVSLDRIIAKSPFPIHLSVSATFTVSTDLSVSGTLKEPLTILFDDLLIPVSFKCSPMTKQLLWDGLWKDLGKETGLNGPFQTFKFLRVKAQAVNEVLSSKLLSFVYNRAKKDGLEEVDIFILLPPAVTLLMQFNITPEASRVNIRCDTNKVALFLDKMLASLFGL
ncbi:AP-5 complex subunit beta-1 [Pelomyxa schiedti]|nr:AP-5 complex subunit beta-1 [Pelomyxa schiedti]